MLNSRDEYDDVSDTKLTSNELIDLHGSVRNQSADNITSPLLGDDGEEKQSPYEEVAINVPNRDDPAMPCFTFRSVFIGILLTCLSSFTSQFFALRTYPVDLNAGIIILLAYIFGQSMAKYLPEKLLDMTLNPGPFSVKEHALILIMATTGTQTARAIEAIVIQRVYYNFYFNHMHAILFVIVMHLLAFSIAGILQRYLVWPAAMIWPSTLMYCGLIQTLDTENKIEPKTSRWKMTRAKFFGLMVLCQFLWYWFPGYIFPLLSAFSLLCMIAPHNVIYSQITGAYGLGVGAFQFDWNACVSYLDSPILVPFWAHVNFFVGFVIVIWILAPILYYSNIWDSKKMPIISNLIFDANGNYFNARKILTKDFLSNETAYEMEGGVQMTAAYAISMGAVFGALPAYVIHTILYHGRFIVEQFRTSLSDKRNDIHAKLMSYYPQVEETWYYIILLMAFVLGLMYCYSTDILPGHIMIVSILLNLTFMLPIGLVTATTNIQYFLSVAVHIVSSFVLPNNPIGYTIFHTFTTSCQSQCLTLLINLKTAHYMKIPPRNTFFVLIMCSMISTGVNYITAVLLLNHVPDICTPKNPYWRCLNAEAGYGTSILMGAAGFIRLFGKGGLYYPLLLGFLVGAILPILSWLLCKLFPHVKWLTLINAPIILASTFQIPPATGAEFATWFLVGFIFNFILYRYAHDWWEKYAYIFSAAMSCGVAICGVTIFVLLENNHIHFPRWWGSGGPTRDGCPLDIANYTGHIPPSLTL